MTETEIRRNLELDFGSLSSADYELLMEMRREHRGDDWQSEEIN